MIKRIGISAIASILIWVALILCATLLKIAFEWLVALDSVLNASLFSTLAGLSLAAAAFLVSADEIQKEKLAPVKLEAKSIREKLSDKEIGQVATWKQHNQPITLETSKGGRP